jgi:pimeloyl-ACP methyl ester carboxylesterase
LLFSRSCAAYPLWGRTERPVDLGTHKINIVCTGPAEARPAVIFEAGGGGSSAAWKGVQAALPGTIRACAYDRAGSGKSDPGPEPRSMDAEVTDLHAVLAKANISAPIVLVGHSLGGILARLYVHKYPDSVAGVLLVDPTDEDDLVFSTKVTAGQRSGNWMEHSAMAREPLRSFGKRIRRRLVIVR